MKQLGKLLVLFSAAVVLTGCYSDIEAIGNDQTHPDPAQQDKTKVTVDYVMNGDTIQVKMPGGTKETVKLLSIDSPENTYPDKSKHPYSAKATEFTQRQLLKGRKVTLEYDGPKRDKCGHLLAYVWVGGDNVNKQLLEKGLARRIYNLHLTYKYTDQFNKAEKAAKKQRKNIWSIDGYAESGFKND